MGNCDSSLHLHFVVFTGLHMARYKLHNNNNNNNNMSRLLAHWLMMDTGSFRRLAGGLHNALLIHGKPLFSTNASRLRFSDLTQYA